MSFKQMVVQAFSLEAVSKADPEAAVRVAHAFDEIRDGIARRGVRPAYELERAKWAVFNRQSAVERRRDEVRVILDEARRLEEELSRVIDDLDAVFHMQDPNARYRLWSDVLDDATNQVLAGPIGDDYPAGRMRELLTERGLL